MAVIKKQSSYLKKYSLVIGTLLIGAMASYVPNPALSQEKETTAKPKKAKRFLVDYMDYNKTLSGLVLVKTAHSRRLPIRAKAPTGTRVSFVNKKVTRLEANRVMFHMLKDNHKEFIRMARRSLEAIPAEFPMEKFSKDEQLAYWLNLRNITVLEAVMDEYPTPKLKRFWKKFEKKKLLNVAGKPMSVRDIEDLIIERWPSQQVIYGFYNGTVGGPNIRKRAYTGKFVWDDLDKNAKEFVNSLRGIQFFKKTAKVSDFYERYPTFFPDPKKDLKKHLIGNMRSGLAQEFEQTTKLKLNVNDWTIADLMNGRMGLSSAGSLGPAALILSGIRVNNPAAGTSGAGAFQTSSMRLRTGAVKGMSWNKYPIHVQAYLRGMQSRLENTTGKVSIEEADSKTTDVPKKKDKKKNN